MKPSRLLLSAAILLAPSAALVANGAAAHAGAHARTQAHVRTHPAAWGQHAHIDCAYASAFCTEVANSRKVFGYYVGHDEPSMLFFSHTPGSGNHMRYNLTLPTDPSASKPNELGKSYAFELSGAEWLGMAMCDTQSYPENMKTCKPDSDSNIRNPDATPKHAGEAYMEMQFYPPGWIPWPAWQIAVGASSCNPTKWCAALNIDSLSLNPVTGKANNTNCLNKVGEEYVNFAFITKSGKAQAPANPVDATEATYTPSAKDLYMSSGDHLQVSFADTRDGLRVIIHDLTTGQTGSMTASAANGFGQVKYDPNGTSCTNIPYNFHPMYSTSTPQTRVTWAAGSYNVAFDTEIGHFQFCTGKKAIPATPFGLTSSGAPTVCPKGDYEGRGVNEQPADTNDDYFCFPGSEALVYKVNGCSYTNVGFDGASYQNLWPNGNTRLHPTPFRFTSPRTGANYNVPYSQAGFETDLPAIESTCNSTTGAGCTLIPQTDQGQPAVFYPFYSTINTPSGCEWEFGADIPGEASDFGQNGQYGTLLQQSYTAKGGSSIEAYEDFRNVISNPC
jgi:hypothetical protein